MNLMPMLALALTLVGAMLTMATPTGRLRPGLRTRVTSMGGTLSTSAGSIAPMDASGGVVVDAMVYGSQQSSSSGNGTIASPELATLEADQSQGGCIAVTPIAASGAGRSRGRFPDGFDADSLCTDFQTQTATTLSAASAALLRFGLERGGSENRELDDT